MTNAEKYRYWGMCTVFNVFNGKRGMRVSRVVVLLNVISSDLHP